MREEERGMRLGVAREKTVQPRQGIQGAASGGGSQRGGGIWKHRRAGLFSSSRLALLRLTLGWRLLLVVGLGILAAVVLVCAVPLYDTLVLDTQLQRTLNTSAPSARNVQLEVASDHISSAQRDTASPLIARLQGQYLSAFTQPTSTYYSIADDMLLLQAGAHRFNSADSATPQLSFQAYDYSATASHMRFLSGGPPQASGTQPEVAITSEMAQSLHLATGDLITATQFGDHSIKITLDISGIWEPVDPADAYWNGHTFASGASSPVIFPLLITYDALFGQLSRFGSVSMRQEWIFYTLSERLNDANIGTVANSLGNLRAHLGGEVAVQQGVTGVKTLTGLDRLIANIQSQQSLLALPLYVIVAQVLGLVLLFVAAMSALLIEGQSQEIATLRSRGTSGVQTVSIFTLQSALLALVAVLVGPFLAAALALALVRQFIAADAGTTQVANSRYLSQLASPREVVAPALVGALLGVAVVAFAAWQAARKDILAYRRELGRTTRAPFWRRYYLDLALAALCFVGYLELNRFGDVTTRQQLAGGGTSPLLLVTPTLLLLAGALLLLRLFPLGAALGARLAARRRGATSLLALAQVERNPGRYTRMTLLLVLAVGLGLFALTFDASLAVNARDRATYTVGADVRITELTGEGSGQDRVVLSRLAALPGVVAVSPTYRTQAQTSVDQGSSQVDVLGIDPATFGRVAGPISWRDDYAGQSLDSLLASLRDHTNGGAAGGSEAPIWALVSDSFASQNHLKMGDPFTLQLSESVFTTPAFVVGGVVHEFPTLYPARVLGGFIVVSVQDYLAAILASASGGDASVIGPNEFWLQTTQDAAPQSALLRALADNAAELGVSRVETLRDALVSTTANPIAAGMRGLLLIGALTAALLAIIGSVAQALLASRQRVTQFAVLRTLGMSGRQLARLLLGEQVAVYLFGLLGGTLLGLLLVSVTLPFLQFSDTTVDRARLGIPPYQLTFSPPGIVAFYAALLAAFALALVIATRYAATIGIGTTLRIGED